MQLTVPVSAMAAGSVSHLPMQPEGSSPLQSVRGAACAATGMAAELVWQVAASVALRQVLSSAVALAIR